MVHTEKSSVSKGYNHAIVCARVLQPVISELHVTIMTKVRSDQSINVRSGL
jgi:hypothetical protein